MVAEQLLDRDRCPLPQEQDRGCTKGKMVKVPETAE